MLLGWPLALLESISFCYFWIFNFFNSFSDFQKNQLGIIDFYRRRIKRIFPALLVVILFCFVLGWLTLLADEFLSLNKHIAAGLAFISNLVLLGESGYFDSASNTKILLHLWSLGIEEQFYIFWPLLLILFCRMKRNIGTLLCALLLASFLINIAFIYNYPTATFYLPFTRVWELLIGAALAYRVVIQNRSLALWGRVDFNAWLGFILLIVANIFINDRSPFPGWWALLPTLSAALLISAGSSAWFNKYILGSRALVWFGLISYPLYLWHWPLLTFARILDGGRQPSSLVRICMVALAVLFAWLTYRLIEKPIRFNKNSIFTPMRLFLIGAAFFFISGIGYFNGGFPNRAAAQLKIANEGDIGHDEFRTYLHAQPNYCEYKDATPNKCNEQFGGLSRIVAVVGDSHAEHILLGLTEQLPNVGFMLFDTNQTLPFISSPTSNHFFDVIDGNKKVDSVILVAYWQLRKGLIAPGSSYLNEIIPTAGKLSEHRKKVFLIDGTPNFSFYPTKCKYEWPFLRIQQCTEANFYEQRHSQFISDFAEAEKQVPITLIELAPLFCDQGVCAMAKDGKLLFRDDNHLGINGSRYIAKDIMRVLN